MITQSPGAAAPTPPSPAGSKVPAPAVWLTAAGFLPFGALSLATFLLPPFDQPRAEVGLMVYGAVILSFLGGVQWGLEMARQRIDAGAPALGKLSISVVPSLIAWVCVAMPFAVGSVGLAAGLGAMLLYDLYTVRQAHAPEWYPKLRIPVTLAVMIALILPNAV
ncbi:DUF3429 domain-containing protein [Roseibium aquae]|nr:DUF3429 domain-containing protein [Roseibium aquae]